MAEKQGDISGRVRVPTKLSMRVDKRLPFSVHLRLGKKGIFFEFFGRYHQDYNPEDFLSFKHQSVVVNEFLFGACSTTH